MHVHIHKWSLVQLVPRQQHSSGNGAPNPPLDALEPRDNKNKLQNDTQNKITSKNMGVQHMKSNIGKGIQNFGAVKLVGEPQQEADLGIKEATGNSCNPPQTSTKNLHKPQH